MIRLPLRGVVRLEDVERSGGRLIDALRLAQEDLFPV